MLKRSDVLQEPRQPARKEGDREAIAPPRAWDVQRFTKEEHEHGDTAGWRFEIGWYRRMGGVTWAWFRREVDDETTIEP